MDLFDKSRKDMAAEVKTSLKWVVLVAIIGLVLLTIYVMVVRAHADPGDIVIRDQYGSFRGLPQTLTAWSPSTSAQPTALGPSKNPVLSEGIGH